MRIATITVANFKGLRFAKFSPSTFSCLVGENNAGKSTLLQALVYALNRPPQLPLDLFYDRTLPVEFTLQLVDVTDAHVLRLAEEHRDKIADFIIAGHLTLIVRYRPAQRVEIKVERLTPNEPRYKSESIATVFQGKRGGAVRQALIDSFAEFAHGVPDSLTISAAKQFISDKIAQLPRDQFTTEEGPLPSGISASITTLLPEPIYIPAVKNLTDDLKTSQQTSFGRLLGLLLADMEPDLATITASLDQLKGLFNRVERDGETVDARHARVQDLESTVERFLQENFPAAKVELRVPPPELRTILNSAQIYIDDGSRDLIDNKGDGIKRSLTFALLQCYVERLSAPINEGGENAPAQQPLMFLFEEPELYLHPKSQRVLFNTLARISDRFQVVVTTHSPLFFAPGVTASFVRVAKKTGTPKPVGILHPVDFKLNSESAEVFRLARFENADAGFFSQRVILFEGESDDAYFKHVAKQLNPAWDFDARNVALVRVSGKGNFARFRKFFSAFGIDVKIVADLDALFDGFSHLGTAQNVAENRATAIQAIDARIETLGIKAEPATRQIKDKLNGQSWRQRYQAAKDALAQVQKTGQVTQELIQQLDGLFVWEADIARIKACREDQQARAAIVPVLDAARATGVCILSKGAIEDYYPDAAPNVGGKPERALAAAALVTNQTLAEGLCEPLAEGRRPELVEICNELFANL